jgi:hypothetical protein
MTDLICYQRFSVAVYNDHWDLIDRALRIRNPSWAPLIYLCRRYGLRRNEGLGLLPEALRYEYLAVTQQLKSYDRESDPIKLVYGPVKDRDNRKIPHILAGLPDLDLVSDWIDAVTRITLHFDTISEKFAELTTEVSGVRYNIDDLRPTFLTEAMGEAVKKDPVAGPEEVRLAAGHANIKTTFGHYVKDTRKLADQQYISKKK